MSRRDCGDSVPPPPDVTAPASFDVTQRFVRVTGQRPNGFIEFEFSVGDPALFAELILPPEAFAEFCLANGAIILPVAPGDNADTGNGETPDDWDWRLSDARNTRFR